MSAIKPLGVPPSYFQKRSKRKRYGSVFRNRKGRFYMGSIVLVCCWASFIMYAHLENVISYSPQSKLQNNLHTEAVTTAISTDYQTKIHEKMKEQTRDSNMPEHDHPGFPFHNPNIIGAIEIVNLVFRATKWNAVRDNCLNSKVLREYPIRRSLAVYGKEVDIMEDFAIGKIGKNAYRSLISPRRVGGHYMTAGGMGCLLSHVDIWRKCMELGYPVIAFEDDIILLDGFDKKFRKVLNDLPKDFGLFYFADMVKNDKSKASEYDFDPDSSIYQLIHGEHWGTYAYMISPTAAKVLYENVFPLKYQVDSYMIATCAEKDLKVYRAKENLVTTDNSVGRVSDVQVTVSKKRLRAVPTIFHVLDLPPMSFTLDQFIQRISAANRNMPFVKIDVWDRQRILAFGEIGHLDISEQLYDVKLLRLQLAILNAYGGMFLHTNFKPRHSLGKVMHDVHGFIAVESNGGSVQYPIIGVVAGEPKVEKMIACLSTILDGTDTQHFIANEIAALKKKSHQCISSIAQQFPTPDSIIIFPAEVLEETGYS